MGCKRIIRRLRVLERELAESDKAISGWILELRGERGQIRARYEQHLESERNENKDMRIEKAVLYRLLLTYYPETSAMGPPVMTETEIAAILAGPTNDPKGLIE